MHSLLWATCALSLARLVDGEDLIRYASYREIRDRMHQLQREAPSLVTLWNAQAEYGLPSPGDCGSTPCEHWFLTITNNSSEAVDRELLVNTPSERPQVFISGNLHGDEKVGPMTLIYFAGAWHSPKIKRPKRGFLTHYLLLIQ